MDEDGLSPGDLTSDRLAESLNSTRRRVGCGTHGPRRVGIPECSRPRTARAAVIARSILGMPLPEGACSLRDGTRGGARTPDPCRESLTTTGIGVKEIPPRFC